jgi:methionine-rich copper-binding protein CopC
MSTDPDDAVAEYRIYRGTTPNGEGAAAIAIVSGSTLSYVDTAVNAGQTYYYKVKAFDTSLNASQFSNEVSHAVVPKVVQVTFRVKVPAFTPPVDFVYITGQSAGVSPDPLCGYCGGTASTRMTETAPGSHIWEITLGIPHGTAIQYKYTRSTYDYVEEWGSIKGFTNRVATVAANGPADLTQLFDDTSDSNPDDNHKAVQNWRDALVTGTNPASGAAGAAPTAITATFNWDVKSDGADFSNAIVVTNGGTPVAGTISHDSATQSLTFTPSVPLAAGTYSVTIDHVVSLTVQNDGIKIRTPYVFSFTVN